MKTLNINWKVLAITLIISATLRAEVVFDGTFGAPPNLLGPNFAIEAQLGKQVGNNLFHSFEKFNLNFSEGAFFWGPNTIENVINRVTGGEPSNIDGYLYSSMPKADMYFLNPAGMIFGPNAFLDIQGSLYISTADYLRLGEDGRFDATYPEHSILTLAPPSAFGFLDNSPAPISKQGSFLAIPRGKILSFIGGDLTLQDSQFPIEGVPVPQNSFITAVDGQINLVSVASSGEVPVDFKNIPNNAFEKFGKIVITDDTKEADNFNRQVANIDVSGGGGGEIYIRGGQILVDNGYVWADTWGHENGKGIKIVADELNLANGSRITAQAAGESTRGNGGNIDVTANRVSITGGSMLDTTTQPDTSGVAGNVTVSATESIEISGSFSEPLNGEILRSGIHTQTFGIRNAGQIDISTANLTMQNNGVIRADTSGKGDAGNIAINVDTISLIGGAQIKSSSIPNPIYPYSRLGNGGNITIEAAKAIFLSGDGEQPSGGLLTNTFSTGKAGTIDISAPILEMQNGATIQSAAVGDGNAGNIFLNTGKVALDYAAITTQSDKSAGGDITIAASDSFYLLNSFVSTDALGKEKLDSGGNITISKPMFSILNHSQLITSGFVGNGGNIRIVAEQFIKSSESILNASSQLGIDGEIQITATDENFSNSLVILTKTLTDASRLLAKSCVESARDESHFVVADYLSDANIEDMLKKPQPPSFQDGLKKTERLAIYQSLQKQLATRQPEILSQLAALYASEHRYPEALQLNKQALRALKLLNAPYWRYKLQWQRARLFKALGEYDNAIIAYQAAIHKLIPIRQHLTQIYRERYPNGERSEFREVLKPIFTELVALLLEQSELLPDNTTTKNELLKTALQYMDKLKTAELQDYFQDDCTKPTIDLEQVEPLHTAIIYPIFLPNRVKLLVSLPKGKRLHKTVPATPQQITKTINTLATVLHCQTKYQTKDCQENHSYRVLAQQLYDWLLRPLEPELSENIHTLVFVPDGPLYSIPMAVLHDGHQFLIEKYALAITPNLTLPSSGKPSFSPRMLYSALTESNHPAFAPIQHYATPMQEAIEQYFGAVTTLKGQNFVSSRLEQTLNRNPYTMLHIFSHAKFSKQVQDTFVVTFNDKLNMKQLEELISPKQYSEVPLDLLTLSACETAKGDERAALGLAGVAYKAGTRSAIATLWAVDEDVAFYFFQTFYNEFAKHSNKARAVQTAQLKLLNNSSHWQHPYYWSPFLLIGNWL